MVEGSLPLLANYGFSPETGWVVMFYYFFNKRGVRSRWFFIPLESVVFLVLALLSLPCRANIARVSVDAEGRQGNELSSRPSISANGRYIAFMSVADNLVANDTNNKFDVFAKDWTTGRIERVSVDAAGRQGNDWSSTPSISANGRYIAFMSAADNTVEQLEALLPWRVELTATAE